MADFMRAFCGLNEIGAPIPDQALIPIGTTPA